VLWCVSLPLWVVAPRVDGGWVGLGGPAPRARARLRRRAPPGGGRCGDSVWWARPAGPAADLVVAVSAAMREDVLAVYPQVDPARGRVVHNGIDTEAHRPDRRLDGLLRHGIDPYRPLVLFVGRVTRQKGLQHLLRAAFELPPDAQLVLCCGQPDTPEIAAETAALVDDLKAVRDGVVRLDGMLDAPTVRQLMTHASVFVCPSVYEPMGIVNLEAMACGTPVVATATGGIPEVVVDGATGLLVPFEARPAGAAGVPGSADDAGEPVDPGRFAKDLAAAVNRLLDDPDLADRMGAAGRERARSHFSWDRAAERTLALYREALAAR
ncbi:glycogen synthase, partial [Streptomyces sp. NPDC058955]|uniref:glycogen synthase n=1 Tax=Streptomyces sp. NPDC058955 TaxID=3346678 RepID=UPI0036A95598